MQEFQPEDAAELSSSERAQLDELGQLIDLAYDAIFVRSFRDRLIRSWNQGAEQLYGWTADEAIGRNPRRLLRSRYPISLEEIEWQLLSVGRWEGEIRQSTKDGREILVSGRWVLRRDERGEPIDILEINSDITARKQAEEDLRRSEERFRLLVANVSDYAIFMLDPRGYVASWNEGAQRIKGYRADQIIGKHFSVFYPEADVVAGKPLRELVIARGEGRYEEEGWRVRKDGSLFWAGVTLTAVRDANGTLIGFAKVTRDLTERRRQQEQQLALERKEAARLRAHAERMERLEAAKSHFLNLASHELRGPLAVINGYLSMLEEGVFGQMNESGARMLPILLTKVAEMNRLVNQMIELARLEDERIELRPERFDLVKLVEQACEEQRPMLSALHGLQVQPPEEPVWVTGDRERIATIINNLVDNAIKYSPEGGAITCRVRSENRWVEVEVEDQGIGIDATDLSKLFTRFGRLVTSENSHLPGTGLGLFVCRELARMHRGDIQVTSTPGVGSRFTLRLPG